MNNKTMKVFSIILDNCGDWLDAREIGYQSDLTSRQVCSIVSRLPSPPLVRKRVKASGQTERIMWDDTPEHAVTLKK